MNLFADIRTRVLACLDQMVAEGSLPDGLAMAAVSVEPPRDASHGDMATNAAMVLAKPAKMNPRVIADIVAAKLLDDPQIAEVAVAGPGFINMRLQAGVRQGGVETPTTAPPHGRSTPIGRASCGGRGENPVVAPSFKKKKNRSP